ncbi:uridine diphosphate glucose pyrophosphatase NUDT22 [Engraulis encrasicolus]|uniref:uridine diphosphate glucose pyrophosphatase NUDT22 n=1 Tax=Engraulis encrasicolus TaxID=184585 RepID=UPI002FD42C47
MDPEVSVLLHCGTWRGLREDQVQVELSSRFNRHSVPEAETHIQSLWEERIAREPWLFNGAKFRFHSAKWTNPQHPTPPATTTTPTARPCDDTKSVQDHVDKATPDTFTHTPHSCCCPRDTGHNKTAAHSQHDAQPSIVAPTSHSGDRINPVVTSTGTGVNGDRENGSSPVSVKSAPVEDESGDAGRKRKRRETALLSLQLGLTCYKDYLGTNWSESVPELQEKGRAQLGDEQALLAQPLGVGAVMATADGQVVLLRRSLKVAEAAGQLDIPGGHPEPKAVCKGISEDQITMETMQGQEEAVLTEIFSSVLAEIRDEVNIPLSCLSEPILLGIALNHTSAGRPSAEFYVRCSLTAEQVKATYTLGGPEANESTDIVFLKETELLSLNNSSPLWLELCPSAKGAIILHQLVMSTKTSAPPR